jgi:type VI secretion system ImpH/TssG family protein
MAVNFFGLFGPNAPLPPHITEYVLERELHHHDRTITAFFNIFHHRLLSLFYRAWAANQKAVDLDRPKDQRYSVYVGALFGVGMEALQERDAVPDTAKLFFSGRLACQTRNAEGLEAILRAYFHVPAEVQPFAGRWLHLPDDCLCRLGESAESSSLGVNAITGSRFWDCQLSFRMKFGPMSLADYERMLPRGDAFERLKFWVLNYCGEHFFWDVQLVLRADEVPPTRLGETGPVSFSVHDLIDAASLAAKLRSESSADPLSSYLCQQLSPVARDNLANPGGHPDSRWQQTLVNELNRIIQSGPIYEPQRFAGVALAAETKTLLARHPRGQDLARLNRRLLEDAYPAEISKHRQAGGLGWTTWLKTKPFTRDADQLILNPPAD